LVIQYSRSITTEFSARQDYEGWPARVKTGATAAFWTKEANPHA